MGRGNWFPSIDRGYRLLYLDNRSVYECDDPEDYDQDEWYVGFECLKKDVYKCLPDSFEIVNGWVHDNYIEAKNNLFYVVIRECECHIAIAVCVFDDSPAFAEYQLDKLKIFENLYEIYGEYCSVRTGPWTSARYQPNPRKIS